MAMFEFENSKKMDLENCETTSSVMVKAKNIDDFKAVNCKQNEESASSLPKKSLLRKFMTLILDKSLNLLVGVVVALIAAALIYK